MPIFYKRILFDFSLSTPSSLISCAAFTALAAGGCSSDVTRFNASSLSLADNSLSSTSNSSVPVKGPYSLGSNPTEQRFYSPSEGYDQPISRMDLPPPPAAPVSQLSPEISQASFLENDGNTLSSSATLEKKTGDTFYHLSQRSGLTEEDLIRLNAQKSNQFQRSERPKVRSDRFASTPPSPSSSGSGLTAGSATTVSIPSKNIPATTAVADAKEPTKDESNVQTPIASNKEVKRQTSTYAPLPLLPSEQPSAPASMASNEKNLIVADLKEKGAASQTGTSSSPTLTLLNDQKSKDIQSEPKEISEQTEAQVSSSQQTSLSLTESGRLRWPVKGRVISPFGPRSNGVMNDGIDISVPLGTDIHAAEDGVVAYAGNQLPAYGNLVLVKHQGGVVTAYAHADEIKVKKGDRVARGQVIATAGKTGAVDQPKLHFEVREGPKAVDPLLHLEKI